jgi:putative SOS response-associated peptidase YedK
LREAWRALGGDLVQTCTLITTEPNKLAATVHDRMPAILKRSDETIWLDPAARVPDLVRLLAPYPEDELEACAVSRVVNAQGRDDASMVEPRQ